MRSIPRAHRRPAPAVERPDLVRGGAPDLAIRQFGETDDRLPGCSGRSRRTLATSDRGSRPCRIAAQPEIAVLGGKQRRKAGARSRVGGRHGQRLKFDAVVGLQRDNAVRACRR